MLGRVKQQNWNRLLKQTANQARKKAAAAQRHLTERDILDATMQDAATAEQRQRILFTRVLPAAVVIGGLLWYMKKRRK